MIECVLNILHCVLNILHDAVPVVVSIAVLCVTWSFNRWQRRLGREQLRHQMYERRMQVYVTFRELLTTLVEGNNDDIKSHIQKVFFALQEVPFLFEGDEKLKKYLDEFYKQVEEKIWKNISYSEALRPTLKSMTPDLRVKFNDIEIQLSSSKLQIPNDHFERLPKEFEPYLKLTDFSKESSQPWLTRILLFFRIRRTAGSNEN